MKNTLKNQTGLFAWILLLCSLSCLTGCHAAGQESFGLINEKEAQDLILAYLKYENPDLNESARLDLEELTTDRIWQALGIQVFTNRSSVFLNQAFIITSEGSVLPMGSSFGDVGVIDMVVTDLDGDHRAELAFSYAFGSGITRTMLALYIPAVDENSLWDADMAYSGYLCLEGTPDSGVLVHLCQFDRDVFTAERIFGELALTMANGTPQPEVLLDENLPDTIFENFWYTR
jgi:hypothetical protein